MTTTERAPTPLPGGERARWGRAGGGGLALVALLLLSLNLRLPIAALPPVVAQVSEALALSPAQAGLLTSIPVLTFALLAAPGSALVARWGPERALLVALAAILAGQLLRSAGTVAGVFGGTALLGAAITIGNVGVPTLIARDFRDRAAGLTGAYAATMNVGNTLAMLATAPMALWWGWQRALASWTLLAALAGGVWWHVARTRRLRTAPVVAPAPCLSAAEGRAAGKVPGRRTVPLGVLLCLAFVGQSGSYYALTAWLPQILELQLGADAAAAGAMAAPFQFMAILGALGGPFLLARGAPLRWVSLTVCALWLSLPLGLLLAPSAAVVWAALGGIAQGANFTLIFTLIVQRSTSAAATRRLSMRVQTFGYAFAAIVPTLMGFTRTLSGSWTVPLLIVAGLLTVMTLLLGVATRVRAPQG